MDSVGTVLTLTPPGGILWVWDDGTHEREMTMIREMLTEAVAVLGATVVAVVGAALLFSNVLTF